MAIKLLDFENHWFSHLYSYMAAKSNWFHLHIEIAFALTSRMFLSRVSHQTFNIHFHKKASDPLTMLICIGTETLSLI